MSKVLFSAAEVKLSEVADIVKVGLSEAPGCVTLMVWEVTPAPLTVIVAVRCVVPVLAAALTVIVPLLVPVAGETVNHVSLLPTVQFVFEVMSNVMFSVVEVKLSEVADIVKLGLSASPDCVTLMV